MRQRNEERLPYVRPLTNRLVETVAAVLAWTGFAATITLWVLLFTR